MSEPTTSLSIPTVTQDDLYRFHTQHFPNAASSSAFLSTHLPVIPHQTPTKDEEDDDDQGLGYYPDGVKRKLTDEQIAIFRHSEIQSFLREQRRQAEEEAPEDGSKKSVLPGQRKKKRNNNNAGKEDTGRLVMPMEQVDEDEDEDELEYMRFLKREREEFYKAERVTTGMVGDVGLDYDEERKGPDAMAGLSRSDDAQACHGRRIIVYDEDEGESNAHPSTAKTKKKREFLWPKIGG